MKKYQNFTIKEYLDVLSRKEPVPGGGSAAALTAALGAGLISMVANYSKGRSKSNVVEKRIQKAFFESEKIRRRLLELVDFDAQAYMGIVKARKKTAKEQKFAAKNAKKIPLEICKLSYRAVQLAPYLVEKGNKNLVSDVEIAIELFLAAFNSSIVLLNS